MTQQTQINAMLSIPETEIRFQFTRSGGPGGQHVNKVSTRVVLLFDVESSGVLDESQKQRIRKSLASRIGSDGILRVAAQDSRSQWHNREKARARFVDLLRKALVQKNKRIATRPSAKAHERRIGIKKLQSEKKRMRRRTGRDESS